MLAFRLTVLLAAIRLALMGILAGDGLMTRASAASSTSAAASTSVPLPAARPDSKDTKSKDAKAKDAKSNGKADAKTATSKASAETGSKARAKPGSKPAAAPATKLDQKPGAHKPGPAMRGSLATGTTQVVPVSAAPGGVPLRPGHSAGAGVADGGRGDIVDRADGRHRRQTGDRPGRQEPQRRRDQCRRHDFRSARAQARGMGDPAQRQRHDGFLALCQFHRRQSELAEHLDCCAAAPKA